MPPTFALEPLTESLCDEMLPLLMEHWREVAQFPDIPLAPAFAAYLERQDAGNLRVYTVRTDRLMGYAVFFAQPNPHYVTSPQAASEVVFIHPTVRAFTALRFLKWCDDQLAAEGCDLVYHRVKFSHNWSKILERIGYTPADLTLVKDLRTASVPVSR